MSSINKMKGFADLFSPQSDAFTYMENTARRVFGSCGYAELRTPILERTEIFARGIGDETDVVQKEMYTFMDKGDRSVTMRPEATAGVMRAYIEDARHTKESISKLFTTGPMFRYERPQKGRMRQFHQINCECLGPEEPYADAELILMLMRFLSEIGLSGLILELNSLGCRQCRPLYHKALKEFLAGLDKSALCPDCVRRMETNPLRVLDCKVPGCREQIEHAPDILAYNCEACREHFSVVLRILEKAGAPFRINPRLVRGLDYYNRTTFEVVSTDIGAQGSVAGGGRYDGLVKALGGPDIPGVGFACGMERLALLMPEREIARPDFYVAVLDGAGLDEALLIGEELRAAGLAGEVSFAAKSAKSQFRQAGKINARMCVVLGTDELAGNTVVLKNMDTGEQRNVPRAGLASCFS